MASITLENSTAQALEAVRSARTATPIIVDFDETLFLRNSTQAYLDSIYPRPMGAAFLRLIKATKPWRWLPSPWCQPAVSKDWLLVVLATLLFPWTWLVWSWRAPRLARQHFNQLLACALDETQSAPIVIATLGFGPIVRPLIAHLPIAAIQCGRYELVSCRLWLGVRDRNKGKLAMVAERLDIETIQEAIVVTDSAQDTPLLAVAKSPYLLVWPGASYQPALSDVYIPLLYSEVVKNPGKSHFIRRVIMWHWLLGVIAFSWLSPHPVANAGGLFFLVVSYWCIYEIGYQENDRIGARYEEQPTLSENYEDYNQRLNLNTLWPWLWSIGLALPGSFLLAMSQQAAPFDSVALDGVLQALLLRVSLCLSLWPMVLVKGMIWLAALCAVRLTFWLYNQFDESARLWIYPFLQTQRHFSLTLLLSTNHVGAVLLMSLVLSRWMQYCIYRCGGARWRFPINAACFVLFICLFAMLMVGGSDASQILTWQAAAAFIFLFLKSFRTLLRIVSRFERLRDR